MPRPTAAQIAYGTATVVCSTLAMLLLSQTSSGIAVAVIALAALGLGLLVAVTVPLPARSAQVTAVRAAEVSRPRIPGQRVAVRTPTAAAGRPVDGSAVPVRTPARQNATGRAPARPVRGHARP
ncbi:hypothetical protein ACIP88_28570 [Streptomyces uncialis]|uniref:hypothetical protein n=1 Tax=Streptomyces uncialis TaxID=1048205 RepID=UPI003804F7FA